MKRAHLTFEGHVQGVSFRANTQRFARKLGLTGWVRNLDDGSVEAVVEGAEAAIRELVQRLKKEVPNARVAKVREAWSDATGEFKNFEIRGSF
jgi:acylphosphatase